MKKIFFIILLISFLPYMAILGYGLYSAVFGYDVYTLILPTYIETLYGLDAFLEAVTVLGLILLYIPILPFCMIYQIIFILIKMIGKLKNRSNTNKIE